MPIKTESTNISDLVKYEADERYSRDVLPVPAGQTLLLGTLLKSSGANFVAAAADDTVLAGISLEAVTTTAASRVTALTRHAVIVESGISYPVGATAPQKAELKAALLALGIKVATEEFTPA